MIPEALVACLRDFGPPANVEEWLRVDKKTADPAGNAPNEAYRRGVRDLLTALGVISGETGEASSPMAYYFIQSLLHSIRDNALSPSNWTGLRGDGCGGTGLQIVHLLEENRLQCTPQPTPLRVIEAVIGIIKARRGDEDVYLMQYDDKAEQFQPIGGKREAYDASTHAALTRELCEELALNNLTLGQDFSLRPIMEHIKRREVSASVHVVTEYDHSFYLLTDVRFPVVTDHMTRWISAAEVAAQRTIDGRAITRLLDERMMSGLGYSLMESVSWAKLDDYHLPRRPNTAILYLDTVFADNVFYCKPQ
jgi:hypothetical protein